MGANDTCSAPCPRRTCPGRLCCYAVASRPILLLRTPSHAQSVGPELALALALTRRIPRVPRVPRVSRRESVTATTRIWRFRAHTCDAAAEAVRGLSVGRQHRGCDSAEHRHGLTDGATRQNGPVTTTDMSNLTVKFSGANSVHVVAAYGALSLMGGSSHATRTGAGVSQTVAGTSRAGVEAGESCEGDTVPFWFHLRRHRRYAR